jgi:hypothetical protein
MRDPLPGNELARGGASKRGQRQGPPLLLIPIRARAKLSGHLLDDRDLAHDLDVYATDAVRCFPRPQAQI